MRRLLRAILPDGAYARLRQRRALYRRRRAAPQMIRGHRMANGTWDESTRISTSVAFTHEERVNVGANVYVGHFCILDGTGGLTLEEGVQLAGWNGVYTHSSHVAIRLYGRHYQEVPESDKSGYHTSATRIGAYAFIGAGAILLPGITVGEGAVVAAGAVVRDDVAPFDLVGGTPARRLGSVRDLDEPYLDDPTLAGWYREWQSRAAD